MVRTEKSKGANVPYDYVGLSTSPQPKIVNFGELMFHYNTGIEYIATKEGWQSYRFYAVGLDAAKYASPVDGAVYVAADTGTTYIGASGTWRAQ